jgi:hypothetical protein
MTKWKEGNMEDRAGGLHIVTERERAEQRGERPPLTPEVRRLLAHELIDRGMDLAMGEDHVYIRGTLDAAGLSTLIRLASDHDATLTYSFARGLSLE